MLQVRFKDLIPPLKADELVQLEQNILREGVRDPLVVWNDTLVDGHNRYAIATKHGLPYNVVEKLFDTDDDAKIWIIRNQFGRRNINDFQRGLLALDLKVILAARAKVNQVESGERYGIGKVLSTLSKPIEPIHTRKELAATARISEGTLYKIEKIKEDAEPTVIDKINSGEITINKAFNEVKKVHVSNNSGENEWYTPENVIELARTVMGSIDTDPASSELANKTVKANVYFTKDNDGLSKEWFGNVWMNPPYAQPLITKFCDKLLKELSGHATQAIVLVNNATDTAWFHSLAAVSTAICFTKGRVKFIDQYGTPSGAPLQGQAILYFGEDIDSFITRFKTIGFVLINPLW